LQPREETLSIPVATSLISAHPFKFSFSFGRLLVLALQFNNKRLLLCESRRSPSTTSRSICLSSSYIAVVYITILARPCFAAFYRH
jgi:hypothetical protein